MSKKTTTHSISEFAFAKDVVKDFPFIIEKFLELAKALYPYRRFACVAHVLAALEDSVEMAKRQQKHYQGVFNNKGEQK